VNAWGGTRPDDVFLYDGVLEADIRALA